MKIALRLLALSLLLMSFQCHEDEHDFVQGKFKVSITPQSNFNINDTIWIEGIISSKLFDLTINDSIYFEAPPPSFFSVMKFFNANQNSNAKDALEKFELVSDTGDLSFAGFCENSGVGISSALSTNERFYKYRIGLKALNQGDYVLSWGTDSKIVNAQRNVFISSNYQIPNHPDQLGFDKCGDLTSILLDSSENEFYFTVD